MTPFNRMVLPLAAAAALAAGPVARAQVQDAEVNAPPTAEAMAFDLFVMRPLSLVGTVLGCGVFIVSLPVDLIAWNFHDPARRLVVEPAKYTFTRELGDLE